MGALYAGQTILGTIGTPGYDAHLPEAWTVTTGSRSVKVAVVDTGIDSQLPDLAANVDVADGANFDVPGTPPLDTNGHGTAMAGIIGAVGNNGVGVTGVDWQVSLIAEKVTLAEQGAAGPTAPGGDPDKQIAAAIDDAVGKGARVVNLSLGSHSPQPYVDQAIAAAPGTLFVVAAGNFGASEAAVPSSPCVTSPGDQPPPNKLCVAAVDETGALDYASSYSATAVDLAAPGTDIAQLELPGTHGLFSNDHGYGYASGTSPAAAIVSGAAALLLAHDPSLDGAALRARILATVDPLPGLAGRVASGGSSTSAARSASTPSRDRVETHQTASSTPRRSRSSRRRRPRDVSGRLRSSYVFTTRCTSRSRPSR